MGSTDRSVLYSFFVGALLTGMYLINPVSKLKDFLIWCMEIAVEGLTGLAGWFVISTIEIMLFFPPPTDIPALTDMYWGLTFPLFWGILTVVGTGFFLGAQLFPTSDKADIDRFMKRTFIAVVMLFAVGHGFGLVVESVNLIMEFMYPDQYRIAVEIDTFEGMATASFTGFAVIIFAIIASPKTLLTYGLFLTMLGMRMLIVYTTYTLFPVLIGFWITDIGALKYPKMVAGMMFKATILLLLFGVLISAILGVGGALAGDGPTAEELGGEREEMVLNSDTQDQRHEGGILAEDDPHLSGAGQSAITSAWVSVYTYFAAVWLCITLTSMILGGSISTGLTKKMMMAKRFKGARARIKNRLNKGDKNSPGDSGSGPGGSGTGPDEGTTVNDRDATPSDENIDTADSAPEPDNANDMDGVPLREKFEHVTDGKVSDAKDAATEKAEEAADKVAEKGSEAGDALEDKATELGEQAGSAAGGYGAIAGKAAGKAAGKLGNLGVTAASYAPKAAMKGANLAKRGGKAYWNVFKQPDAMSSIGEMGRIARESPIGKPDSPDGNEDGPADVDETETMDEFDTDDTEDTDADDDDDEEMDDDDPSAGEEWAEQATEAAAEETREDPEGEETGKDSESDTENQSGENTQENGDGNDLTASPDDPVDKLYEEDDPSARDKEKPAVNEDAAEAVAEDIHESFDSPSENKVREEVHDRVDQDLGDDIDAMGAEHAVMDKYKDVSGRDDLRDPGDDYKWA